LEFEIRQTGYGTLGTTLATAVTGGDARHVNPPRNEAVVTWLR
jgi:hypothetical protein